MIQPKTLEALNYFLDEDIHNCKESIEENKDNKPLAALYTGHKIALEYARDLINSNWKNEQQIEAENYFKGLTREELKRVLIEAGFEVEDGEGKVIFTDNNWTLNDELVNQILSTEITKVTESNTLNGNKLSKSERIEQARKILDSRRR